MHENYSQKQSYSLKHMQEQSPIQITHKTTIGQIPGFELNRGENEYRPNALNYGYPNNMFPLRGNANVGQGNML